MARTDRFPSACRSHRESSSGWLNFAESWLRRMHCLAHKSREPDAQLTRPAPRRLQHPNCSPNRCLPFDGTAPHHACSAGELTRKGPPISSLAARCSTGLKTSANTRRRTSSRTAQTPDFPSRQMWLDTSRSEKIQKAGLWTEVHKQALDFIGIFVPSFRFRLGSDGNSLKTRKTGGSRGPQEPS